VLKGFLAGVVVMVLIVGALLVYRSYTVYCPCGFKYDPFSGGCVVDLHAGPCTNQGGGSPPGQSSSGSSRQTVVSPYHPPSRCGLWVGECKVRPDWKAAEFKLNNASGTVYTTPPKIPVTVKISVQDAGGGGCAKITGTIDVPVDATTTIPFDQSALTASFPVGSSSTSGTPSTGLVSNIHDDCRGTLMWINAFPVPDVACGCVEPPFQRD
jgi:hypothetical protein